MVSVFGEVIIPPLHLRAYPAGSCPRRISLLSTQRESIFVDPLSFRPRKQPFLLWSGKRCFWGRQIGHLPV